MADESKAAVYVSWKTFQNAIENLAQGIPNQIDRTTFPGLSGGVQSQLLAGLKFLGLVTDDEKPTQALHQLAVTDEAKRKAKLKELLEERYADIFAIDLMKATQQQLLDKMGEAYNVTGDTKEKAVRFFLLALQYLGIQVSRFIKVPGSTGPANGAMRSRKRSTRRATDADEEKEEEVDTPPARPSGTSRQVQLKSGGTLTVTASIDLFQLSSTDRDFVFKLIDELNKYEKGATASDVV